MNGQKLLDITPIQRKGYVEGHFDMSPFSEAMYVVSGKTENGVISDMFHYGKNPSTTSLPNHAFAQMEKNNAKNLDLILEQEEQREKPKDGIKFTGDVELIYEYVSGERFPHETTTFVENVYVPETGTVWFDTPTHNLTTLNQEKDIAFKVVNGHTGDPLSVPCRILNQEREIIGTGTSDENGNFYVNDMPAVQDSTIYFQASHPTLRNMEYNLTMTPRTTLSPWQNHPYTNTDLVSIADTLHAVALFEEPENFWGVSNGEAINDPGFTWERASEGIIPKISADSLLANYDGRLFLPWIRAGPGNQEKINVYNLTESQEQDLIDYSNYILGGTLEDFYNEVAEPCTSSGINFIGDTGNTTNVNAHLVQNDIGNTFAEIDGIGETETTGGLSMFHEMMWYTYTNAVSSEDSPINTSSNMWSVRDPLSMQYFQDIQGAKYDPNKNWFTGEASDVGIEVPTFGKDFNQYNVVKLK